VPIYEYKCRNCGCHFELKQGYEAPTETRCPECERRAGRLVSPFAFRFADGQKPKAQASFGR